MNESRFGPVRLLLVAACIATPQSAMAQTLFRTPIAEEGICSVTARWLAPPTEPGRPIRAWAGIVIDETGGPRAEAIRNRSNAVVSEWRSEAASSSADAGRRREMSARIRHAPVNSPQYFDGVLLEYRTTGTAGRRFDWIVDYDLDGDLNNEVPARVNRVRGRGVGDELLISVERTAAGVADFRFDLQSVDSASAKQPPTPTTRSPALRVPAYLQPLMRKLRALDDIRVRKQHLDDVVAAADRVIIAIDRRPGGSGSETLQRLLADVLYRKGRALGYKELPDVVAIHPIEDQAALDEAFEATFQRLDDLVDTTQPDYILLHMRRERRRGHRGTALDLVEVYRTTHPNPVWHYKKRYDLLEELGLPVHAHQAAAELWLFAEMPNKPVPTVFAVAATGTAPVVIGDWPVSPPWRSSRLMFQRVADDTLEAVAWLDTGKDYRLDNAVVVSNGQRHDSFRVDGPSVANVVVGE